MSAPTVVDEISVREYLGSSCEPDCDYVDGHLEARNLGEFDHGRIQALVAAMVFGREREWNVRVVVEQRVQVSATRFRVPDICLLRRDGPVEQIVRQPPLVCIEVLSPDDTYNKLRRKVADYEQMGVKHVWLINPQLREGMVCTPTGWEEPAKGTFVVPGTAIYLSLADIFSRLDES